MLFSSLFPGAALVQNGVRMLFLLLHYSLRLQQEVILARIEQILASRSLTEDEYAQLLYERGVLHDSLGLRALARNDFSMALSLRPDMLEILIF